MGETGNPRSMQGRYIESEKREALENALRKGYGNDRGNGQKKEDLRKESTSS